MPTLFLKAPSSAKNETDFRSDHDAKMARPSLVRTVLARRYKILETVDLDSFKAHDLALDQTVTVRRVFLTSRRAGETWRQKVQQLALLRDPNFLNILDVIIDTSGAFVITERSRGCSMADLLRQRSRLDLEDVLRLTRTTRARACNLAREELMSDRRPVQRIPSELGYPFSTAVRSGDTWELSGQVGLDASVDLVPGGVAPETQQCLENIRGVLADDLG